MDEFNVDMQLAAIEQEIVLLCSELSDDVLRGRLGSIVTRLDRMRVAMVSPAAGDKRRDMRSGIAIVARIEVEGTEQLCAIRNVSVGGVLVDTDIPLNVGSGVVLALPEAGRMTATVLAVSRNGTHLAFTSISQGQEIALLELMKNRYAA